MPIFKIDINNKIALKVYIKPKEINFYIVQEHFSIAFVHVYFDSEERMHEKLRELAWADLINPIVDFGNYKNLWVRREWLCFRIDDLRQITIPCDGNKLISELQKLYPKEENKMPELQIGDWVSAEGFLKLLVTGVEGQGFYAVTNHRVNYIFKDCLDVKSITRDGKLIWERK